MAQPSSGGSAMTPKSRTKHAVAAPVPEPAEIDYTVQNLAALRQAQEARADAVASFERTLASSSAGKRMIADRRQLARTFARTYRKLLDHKTTRARIAAEQGQALAKFE